MASTTPTHDQAGNFGVPGNLNVGGQAQLGGGIVDLRTFEKDVNSDITAVSGCHYRTTNPTAVTFTDPPAPGMYFVRPFLGEGIVGGVAYTADTNATRVITRKTNLLNIWETTTSTAPSAEVVALTDALAAADTANAIIARNHYGPTSQLYYTDFRYVASSLNIAWEGVAASSGSGMGFAGTYLIDPFGQCASLNCGSVATAFQHGSLLGNVNYYLRNGKANTLAALVKLHQGAFTEVATGVLIFGWHDATGAADAEDGVYFAALNGGNWFAWTSDNSVRSSVDTGIAPSATAQVLEIFVPNTGNAIFKIDGVEVASIPGNVPSTAGRHTMFRASSMKIAANANAVTMILPWCYWKTDQITNLV